MKPGKFLKFYICMSFLFVILHLNMEGKSYDFDFSKSNRDWEGDFADYNVGDEAFFELST